MDWLGDGMFFVSDIFGINSSVKCETLVNWNLTAEGVVSIYRDDERAQEHL